MYKRAFSLIEILVVIAIVSVLMTVLLNVWGGTQQRETLRKSVNRVAATIREARADTIASKNDAQYGIYFDADSVVAFQGGTYVAGSSTNTVVELADTISIHDISLSNGTSSFAFERITGTPSATGTVAVVQELTPAATTTIKIHGSGLISVE